MKIARIFCLTGAAAVVLALSFGRGAVAQPQLQSIAEGFRLVEVASVSDAIEQLYRQRTYLSHDMRPVFKTKFAGPAVTVLLKREEHTEGSKAEQGMLDAIDAAAPGSVYVMVLSGGKSEDEGLNYAGIGGLMATAMKFRGLAGAVIDGSVRDIPQITKLQFPVYSRGIVPSTTVNHYRFAGVNVPVKSGGVTINPGDIIAADEDGVVVAPAAHAADILKKAQELDDTEHQMIPFIEKYRSIKEAVAKFGRI